MMKTWLQTVLTSVAVLAALSGASHAETRVELKGVHLCCGGCTKAVAGILKMVEGVTGKCDQKAGTVTITAKDDAAARNALDALAAGGFHGESNNKELAIKDDSGAKGKAKSVTITGIHNCCGSCCRGIKATLKKVDGVTGDTARPKATTFDVTGDFDAQELVKALNTAGFHVKVKQ